MITIYFTDKSLTFAPEQYTPSADERVLSESEVTSANLDNLFDFCNKIVVPTNDYRGAAERFATQFVYIEAAGGIVENSNGEILLIFRRGRWDLPKGHIDAGEEALQAAIREIEEETGVTGLNFATKLGNTLHAYNVYGKWELKNTYWFAFNTEHSATTPQTEEDITAAMWVDKTKLTECMTNSYPTIREIVYKYEHRS
jgi:8-oxo-dGTP pyrophosphatase MutT (NUDIX family)